jgi:acyl dehydratase
MNQLSERYLEDFAVGQTFGSGRLRIDGERALAFAAEFDRQPFHLDEAAARRSIFGGLTASGWHTAAVTMRLLVETELKPAGGLIGAGLDECRWPRPVRPDDELRVECEVIEVRPSKSRPAQGLIKLRTTTAREGGGPMLGLPQKTMRLRPTSNDRRKLKIHIGTCLLSSGLLLTLSH